MFIDENSTIKDLTGGAFSSLFYNSASINYTGSLVPEIMKLIKKTGCDVTNTNVNTVGSIFRQIVLNYQKKFGLPETGVIDDELLHDIYKRAKGISDDEIASTDGYEYNSNNSDTATSDDIYDPHYEPFFLNNSSKVFRKNHKDIIIDIGAGANRKIIKDVFMRSVSVQVDTSGNPISEVYNFIARDIKESDANEDINKYIGEDDYLSASSDIKYSYTSLYKDS